MRTSLFTGMLASLLLASAAWAAPCDQAAPAAPAATAAPATQAPAAAQAQRPQSRRSYSYEPSTTATTRMYAPANRGWSRSVAPHDAGFKARGRYNF